MTTKGDQSGLAATTASSENILGWLLFTSIRESYVPKEVLGQLWAEANLPRKYIPDRLPLYSAFTKATEALEQKNLLDTLGNVELHGEYTCSRGRKKKLDGHYGIRTLVRAIPSESGDMIRHVVREIVDGEGEALLYGTVGIAVFSKEDQVPFLTWENTLPGEETAIEHLEQKFWEAYALHSSHFDGEHIRYAVQKLIDDEQLVRVTATRGVHFVPREKKWVAEGLGEFFEGLGAYAANLDRPATCFRIPTVDEGEARRLVSESFEDLHEKALQDVLKQIRNARRIKSGPARDRAIQRASQRVEETRQSLAELLESYKELLQNKFEGVSEGVLRLKHIGEQLKKGNLPNIV